jgi:hypothetical protein
MLFVVISMLHHDMQCCSNAGCLPPKKFEVGGGGGREGGEEGIVARGCVLSITCPAHLMPHLALLTLNIL